MDDVTLARAVHVLAIVHWIGGVWFVTSVILPSVLALPDAAARLQLFEQVERRFSAQARLSVPLAGLSGFYMAWKLDAWQRFLEPQSWWMAAMLLVWLLFMAILFVIEPLFGRPALQAWAVREPRRLFVAIQAAHVVLLIASLVTAGAAVLGAHGLLG